MTTIRMMARISGTRDGASWPDPGETLTVDAAEAVSLVGAGLAVVVDDAPAERAVVSPDAEVATAKPRRKS